MLSVPTKSELNMISEAYRKMISESIYDDGERKTDTYNILAAFIDGGKKLFGTYQTEVILKNKKETV